jgi:hypothetical protein
LRKLSGTTLIGEHFAESLEILPNSNASILASLEDGTPAITTSSFGLGQTIFIGSFLANRIQSSYQGVANVDPAFKEDNDAFLLGLLEWAGITRPFTTSHDGKQDSIVVRLHQNPEGYLLYTLNHGYSTETISIKLNVKEDVEYTLKEILQDRVIKKTSNKQILQFETDEISGSGVEIWSITPTSLH